MNSHQMALQLRSLLAAAVWPEGSGDPVFGDRMAFVSAGVPSPSDLPGGFPFALVVVEGGTGDDDDPNLLLQTFGIYVVSDVPGGRMGEAALTGGAKAALGSSAMRGVLELNGRVAAAVKDLRGVDGTTLKVTAAGVGPTITLPRGSHMAVGETSVQAWTTLEPSYTPPSRLAKSGNDWTWTGDQCSSRFDFIQYRFGYVAGATPAQTVADLDTLVYTGATAAVTHTPVIGQAYSVFADYGSREGTLIDGTSDGREIGAFLTT